MRGRVKILLFNLFILGFIFEFNKTQIVKTSQGAEVDSFTSEIVKDVQNKI